MYGCIIKLQAIYLTQSLNAWFYARFPCKTSFSLHACDWRPAKVSQVATPRISTPTDLRGPGLTLTTSAWNERKVLQVGKSRPWEAWMIHGWEMKKSEMEDFFRFLVENFQACRWCWLPNLFSSLKLEGMKAKHSQSKSKTCKYQSLDLQFMEYQISGV